MQGRHQDLHPAKNLSHRAALGEGMKHQDGDSLRQRMEGPACRAAQEGLLLAGSLDMVERRLRFIQPLDGSLTAREDPRHVSCDWFGGEGVGQGSWGLDFHPVPERGGLRMGLTGFSKSTPNGQLNFAAAIWL